MRKRARDTSQHSHADEAGADQRRGREPMNDARKQECAGELESLVLLPVDRTGGSGAATGPAQLELDAAFLKEWSLIELLEGRHMGLSMICDSFLEEVRVYLAARPALMRGELGKHLAALAKVRASWRTLRGRLAQEYGESPTLYDKIETRMRTAAALIAEEEEAALKALAAPGHGEPKSSLEESDAMHFDLDSEYAGLTIRGHQNEMTAELDGVNLSLGVIYEDKTAADAQIDANWVNNLVTNVIPNKVIAIYTRGARVATRDRRDAFKVPPIEALRAIRVFEIRLKGRHGPAKAKLLWDAIKALNKSHGKYFLFRLSMDSGVEDDLASSAPKANTLKRSKSMGDLKL